jgi:RNA polymerase sigma-70 factor (ECF subfamily)
VNRAAEDTGALERLARGDSAALREIMQAYGGLVWSLALRFCRQRADAEDAVQEIFTDLWKSAHRFDPKRASERVFISMIARRRLIDRLRRERRRGDVESKAAERETEFHAPGDVGERGWDAELAETAIEQLSAEQQRVLRMGILQGLTQSEIATATDMPLGTVKTHMRRGLIRLREVVQSGNADGTGTPGEPSP